MRRRQHDHRQAPLKKFLNASKAAFLQLLVAAAQKSTFDRIIDCPTYPVPVKTADLAEAVRLFDSAMQDHECDLATLLAQLYSSVQPLADRKRLGQFFTALPVATWALKKAPPSPAERICDAGAGTGIFASALVRSGYTVDSYVGVESDPILALCAAHTLNSINAPKSFRIWYANFLLLDQKEFAEKSLKLPSMVMGNPPFVRYHHLAGRELIRDAVKSNLGISLSPLSGSGSYFLGRAAELAGLKSSSGADRLKGRMLFFLPKEAEGAAHVQRLRDDLRRAHRWTCRVLHVPKGHTGVDGHASNAVALLFLFEQENQIQKQLAPRFNGGTRIHDVLKIKRGISTGRNDFFVLTDRGAKDRGIDPEKWLKRVLPTRIHLAATKFSNDHWEELRQTGHACWLLVLPNAQCERFDTAVQEYLKEGLRRGLHTTPTAKSLRAWFSLPIPPTPPDLFVTYFFRGSPRFISNDAGVLHLTNILGGRFVNPGLKIIVKEKIIDMLNIKAKEWMKKRPPGREYKGGLRKIEPKELSMLPIDSTILELAGRPRSLAKSTPISLFELIV